LQPRFSTPKFRVPSRKSISIAEDGSPAFSNISPEGFTDGLMSAEFTEAMTLAIRGPS
jgi:hypothetical protein